MCSTVCCISFVLHVKCDYFDCIKCSINNCRRDSKWKWMSSNYRSPSIYGFDARGQLNMKHTQRTNDNCSNQKKRTKNCLKNWCDASSVFVSHWKHEKLVLLFPLIAINYTFRALSCISESHSIDDTTHTHTQCQTQKMKWLMFLTIERLNSHHQKKNFVRCVHS